MLKRALVATVATLSVLPAAFAAAPTFTGIFGQVVEFLGPQGMDLLFAFGIVSTIMFMALSNVPSFKEGGVGKALFAMIAGLATGFYVFTQKIPFLSLLGPYIMLIVAIFMGLMLIYIVKGIINKTSLTSQIAVFGLGSLIIGALIAVFSPAISWIGILVALFGAGLMIVGGVMWLTGVNAGTFGPLKDAFRDSKAIKRDLKGELNLVITGNNLELKVNKLLQYMIKELTAMQEQLQQGNWEYIQHSISGVKNGLTKLKEFITKEKQKANAIIQRANNAIIKEGKAGQDTGSSETFAEGVQKRVEVMEQQYKKIDNWEMALLNEDYLDLEKLAADLAAKNYADANNKIQNMRKLLKEIDSEDLLEEESFNALKNFLNEGVKKTSDDFILEKAEFIVKEILKGKVLPELEKFRKESNKSIKDQFANANQKELEKTALTQINTAIQKVKDAETSRTASTVLGDIGVVVNEIKIAIKELEKVIEYTPANEKKGRKYEVNELKTLENALKEAEEALKEEEKAYIKAKKQI